MICDCAIVISNLKFKMLEIRGVFSLRGWVPIFMLPQNNSRSVANAVRMSTINSNAF